MKFLLNFRKKSNLEWVKGASKPVEDDQLYMNKGRKKSY